MSINLVTKAVIPVAGFGARMLPATKAIPKELLTLVDRPIIQYIIDEAYQAGIREIVLVNHARKTAIEDYFDTNFELEWQLERRRQHELLDEIRGTLPDGLSIRTVRQAKGLGLGHAILCARASINNDNFAVLLPDVLVDYCLSNKAEHNLSGMISQFEETCRSQVMVTEVDTNDISKYGIVQFDGKVPENGGSSLVTRIVEKPSIANAPSNLAVVGRYVLSKTIWPILEAAKPGVDGEIQLTDAIDSLISTEPVEIYRMTGKSFDCGSKEGYINAFVEYALNRFEFRERVIQTVKNHLR